LGLKNRSLPGKTLTALVIIGALALQGWLLAREFQKLRPLLDVPTLAQVRSLSLQVPRGASLLTSPRLAPWAQGFTEAKVYAPGILRDRFAPWQWRDYWASETIGKISFLNQFPKPFYIFLDDGQENLVLPQSACIRKLDERLYEDRCEPGK
jgi:hypothetical protein